MAEYLCHITTWIHGGLIINADDATTAAKRYLHQLEPRYDRALVNVLVHAGKRNDWGACNVLPTVHRRAECVWCLEDVSRALAPAIQYVAVHVVEYADGHADAQRVGQGTRAECDRIAETMPAVMAAAAHAAYGANVTETYFAVVTAAEWRSILDAEEEALHG